MFLSRERYEKIFIYASISSSSAPAKILFSRFAKGSCLEMCVRCLHKAKAIIVKTHYLHRWLPLKHHWVSHSGG